MSHDHPFAYTINRRLRYEKTLQDRPTKMPCMRFTVYPIGDMHRHKSNFLSDPIH
jgi:hypothetical protein